MDDVRRFCRRMLGEGGAVDAVMARLEDHGHGDRLAALRAAVAACRELTAGGSPRPVARATEHSSGDLASAVAVELAAATARLAARQREALALRDLTGLSHAQLATVTQLEVESVAPLLATARLALRDELHGAGLPVGDCPERERALRTITLRQDHEPVPEADDAWLIEHLGHCSGCARAHSALWEAAACYRAWRSPSLIPDGKDAALDSDTAPS